MSDHPRIELAIRNSLARIDASSADNRQRVYAAALRSLDRQLQSKGEEGSERSRLLRDRLVATIDMIEDGYVAPMLVEDLHDSFDLSDMTEPEREKDQMTTSQQPDRNSSKPPRRRTGLWSAGLVILLGGIAVLTYIVSTEWVGTSTKTALGYEVAPPYPMAHGPAFEVSLNEAGGFVTVANKSARTAEGGPLPNLLLEADLEEKFSGKTVEVTISARAPAGTTAAQLEAVYYTSGLGNSGPHIFPLGPEYTDVSFTYDVPQRAAEPNVDNLGIGPASTEANASVDVRSVQIRIVPKP